MRLGKNQILKILRTSFEIQLCRIIFERLQQQVNFLTWKKKLDNDLEVIVDYIARMSNERHRIYKKDKIKMVISKVEYSEALQLFQNFKFIENRMKIEIMNEFYILIDRKN